VYAAKFKHCLNRALSLVKTEVNKCLQEASSQVNAAVQQHVQEGDLSNAYVFPLIYGKFSASIAKLKRIFTEIENRRNAWPE
jgi:hypothetical protein